MREESREGETRERPRQGESGNGVVKPRIFCCRTLYPASSDATSVLTNETCFHSRARNGRRILFQCCGQVIKADRVGTLGGGRVNSLVIS